MENAAKLELNNPPAPRHDYLEGGGANILAAVVRAYWSTRATTVKVWVERDSPSSEVMCVRSNLVNGLPVASLPANHDYRGGVAP